jgi:hypothetical protein
MNTLELSSNSCTHSVVMVNVTEASELTLSQPPANSLRVSTRRTRHLSPRWIWLLRPLFRYSRTIGGYVLRVGGRSRGPILYPKQSSRQATISQMIEYPAWRELRNLRPPPFIGEGVGDRREDGRNGRAALVAASGEFTDSDEDLLSESGDEKQPRIPQKLTVGKGLMRPYDESNPCPKCGSTKASVKYHDPGTGHQGCDPGEHIHRECLTCGYPWSDACVELKEKEPLSESPISQAFDMGHMREA